MPSHDRITGPQHQAGVAQPLPSARDLAAQDDHDLLATTANSGADAGVDEAPARVSTIGRFVVLRRLGAGAMGVVYLAYDNALDRRIAVKVLRTVRAAEPEMLTRMHREAQAMARLSHPNVLQIYEAGESEGSLFIAMEYVRGGSLATWLADRGDGDDWRAIVAMFVQAGRGLAAAHAAGLVHRDFKPENVLVGDDQLARVADFGLARGHGDELGPASSVAHGPLLATTLTATRGVLGTPAYMSPEQHEGLPTDARTDQFSFCVALWEALHGERPFAGDTLAALAAAIHRGVPRPPPAGTRVPTWLREALTRGLAVDPDQRWPTMPELLAVLSDDPAARRRRRALIGVTAVLLVATIAGLVHTTVLGQRRAEDATKEAALATRRADTFSDERDRALARATHEASRARDTLRMAALLDLTRDPTSAALLLQEVEDPAHTPEWTPRALATLAAPISTAVLRGHGHAVEAAHFIDADEGRVVTVSVDRTARVWRRDGVGDPQVLQHEQTLFGVVVSPDRRRFVTLGDRVARVWDAAPGAPVIATGELPCADVTRMAAFTADGLRLATVDKAGDVRLWELASGRLLAELGAHTNTVHALAFDPTGQQLVTGDSEGNVMQWRTDGGPARTLPRLGGLLHLLHIDADGILAASEAGVEQWSGAGPLRRPLRGHSGPLTASARSPDGREIATAGEDGSVRLWDPLTAREVARVEHKGKIEALVYSPDSRWLATLGPEHVLLSRRGPHPSEHALQGHEVVPNGAAFSSDSAHLLTYGDDHEARVWDLRSLADTRRFIAPPGGVEQAYGGCDVGRVAALGSDGALRMWSCEGPRPPTTLQLGAPPIVDLEIDEALTRAFFINEAAVWRVELPDGAPQQVGVHPRAGWTLAPSPDGRHLVSTGYDRTAWVWDLHGQRPPIALTGHTSALVWRAAWSPDGATIATIGNDRSVRIWPIGPVLADSSSAVRELAASQVFTGHVRGAKSVAFAPDGARVLTSSPDATARIWAEGAAPVILDGHRGAIYSAKWSPDGAHVATASEDGTARIWSSDGVTPPRVLRGHRDAVSTIAWSPDGRAVVTASDDGTARVWLADSGLTSDVFDAGVAVHSARFTGDGVQVLLAVADDSVRLWRPDRDGAQDSAALRARLQAATTSCLTARARELLLLEDAEQAMATHAACEARHGRTPDRNEGVLRSPAP